jgi:hypothetical protein
MAKKNFKTYEAKSERFNRSDRLRTSREVHVALYVQARYVQAFLDHPDFKDVAPEFVEVSFHINVAAAMTQYNAFAANHHCFMGFSNAVPVGMEIVNAVEV